MANSSEVIFTQAKNPGNAVEAKFRSVDFNGNNVLCCKLSLHAPRKLPVKVFAGVSSNDSLDWKTPPVDEMVSRVCKRAAPGDIMLFHAGKKNTAEALRQIISRLQSEGYSFKPVGELIFPAPYTIDHAGRQRRG